MAASLVVTYALAIVVGITIGVFGGGGAVLMVPILTYITGLGTDHAVTASLFVVGTTSLFSTALHARSPRKDATPPPASSPKKKGNVRWGLGAVFGVFAMVGAFIGGQLTPLLPSSVVMTIFAVVMVGSGVGMIRKRRAPVAVAAGQNAVDEAAESDDARGVSQRVKIVVVALAIGVLSGLVGAGGGFLIVPALTLLMGFAMPVAVGTSLLVVAMQSASGFISHILVTPIDWVLILSLTALAMLGTVGGSAIGSKVPAASLKRAFGVFVLFMAAMVFIQEYVVG